MIPACAGCKQPTETQAKAHKMIGPSTVTKLVPLHLAHRCADLYDEGHGVWTIARQKKSP